MGRAALAVVGGAEQDRFRLNRFAWAARWRLKRESCSIPEIQSKIHDRSEALRSETTLL
jgi:hypothetical protein